MRICRVGYVILLSLSSAALAEGIVEGGNQSGDQEHAQTESRPSGPIADVFKNTVDEKTDLCREISHNSSKSFEITDGSGQKNTVTLYKRGAVCGPERLLTFDSGCHEIIYSDHQLVCQLGATKRLLGEHGLLQASIPDQLKVSGLDSNETKVQKALAFAVMANCNKGFQSPDKYNTFDRLDPVTALGVAECFQTTDFWKADSKYTNLAHGENIAGTGTGLAMACTRARGISCTKSFMRAAVDLHSSGVTVIDKPGKYNFTGYGAALSTVVVLPGVKADISISGHSSVYMPTGGGATEMALGVSCSNDHFGGCHGL